MINEETPSKTEHAAPTLIYVAGLAYSGTTLFASTLGHSENIINGGEINYVENDYHREKYCSCGAKIDDCTLWKPLLATIKKEAASGKKTLNFAADQSLRPIDSRARSIWKKILLVAGVSAEKLFGASEIADYVERHNNFFRAFAKQANTDFVVDASKSFARLDVLNRHSDLPIHVIFLKRSPIQSYASRLKRAKKRNNFYMPIFAPFYLAIILATTLAIRRQMKCISNRDITFVDYETFVQTPEIVQDKLSKVLNTNVDFGIQNKVVPIGHLHIFTGNIWLSQALKKGQSVELRLGDGQSSLSWFERFVFRLFQPISALIERK